MKVEYENELEVFSISSCNSKCLINKYSHTGSEAATETIFENICSFLPGAPFSGVFKEALCVHQTDANFPGRSVCSPNRYKISRRMWSVRRTDTFFQEPSLCIHRTDTDFTGTPF